MSEKNDSVFDTMLTFYFDKNSKNFTKNISINF